ncbi:MAG: TonB-dependent receptor, partial [Nitrospirae bacterium]|nr:TonB-dependent receptor [Nitrospirota bacterium]
MGKHLYVLILSVVFFFNLSYALYAEDEPFLASTKEELLMFYEEKELTAATRYETPLKQAPVSAIIITAREIKDMGARNIVDVLKTVPEIGVTLSVNGILMFEMRGISTLKSEKILFMIDGHVLHKPFQGQDLPQVYYSIATEKIKQIEIIKGPASALYGADAFLGVINVVTKEPADIDGVQMAATGGSFGTGGGDILYGKKFDDLSLVINYDYLTTEGYKGTIKKDILSKTPYSEAPGQTDLSRQRHDGFVELSYKDLTYRGQVIDIGRIAQYIGLNFALTHKNDGSSFLDFWNDLKYKHDFSDALAASARMYFDRWAQDARVEIFPAGVFGSFPEGMLGRPMVKNSVYGVELQGDAKLSANNRLIFGTQYEHEKQYDVVTYGNYNPVTGQYIGSVQDLGSSGNFIEDADREIYSLYAQDEWSPVSNLHLNAGGRFDKFNDFGSTFNPRGAAVWEFVPDADLKVMYGTAFRAPNFVEMYTTKSNPTTRGNPDLSPEKAKTFETSLAYRFTKNLRGSVGFFKSLITDLIQADTTTPQPFSYRNIGSVDVDGIEAEFRGNYGASNYWKLSYIF